MLLKKTVEVKCTGDIQLNRAPILGSILYMVVMLTYGCLDKVVKVLRTLIKHVKSNLQDGSYLP
jgi:hypothetical protein